MKTTKSKLEKIPISRISKNPHNPRDLFDKEPMDILKKSIKEVGILVPLLVYENNSKEGTYTILDGERRWRCSTELFETTKEARFGKVPANIIEEPSMEGNILTMFNIHNVKEEWELMPTAKKLQVLIDKFDTRNEQRLSELTGLSTSQVSRCKILLSLPKMYQDMMLHPDPNKRVKTDIFIEMFPVLNLIKKEFTEISDYYSRDKLISIFFKKYITKVITNVLHFRKLAEVLRGTKQGFPKKKASKILKRILENENVGITDYEEIIETHIKANFIKRNFFKIMPSFKQLDILDIGQDKEFVDILKQLKKVIDAKLDDIEKNIRNL